MLSFQELHPLAPACLSSADLYKQSLNYALHHAPIISVCQVLNDPSRRHTDVAFVLKL